MTTLTSTNNLKHDIEQDITAWLVEYIEKNHKFYNYKFPPCPYAKSARLANQIDICPYQSGSMSTFVRDCVDQLINNSDRTVSIVVFPYYARWNYYLKYVIDNLNKKIVNRDFYAQYGIALTTQNRFSGPWQGYPYFIVIINKLSDVLDGHRALLKTDYYTPWAKHHYDAVVNRRQQKIDKYKK